MHTRGFSRSTPALVLVLVLSFYSNVAAGIDLDLTSTDSIKSVASTIAWDMMQFYKGNLSGNIPGELPGPPPTPTIVDAGYYWWECGAMFGSLIDYWYYTGDSTYNDVVTQGMLHQVGSGSDYLPQNQSNGMGNDDQGFWGMSAMTAAELGFPDPPATQPQWLALAQAVYNTQLIRFDNLCGGGLHWQVYNIESGYSYKNAIANGCFFNLAARLALYTGNSSYADEAISTYDWVTNIGFIDEKYNIYDGADSNQNCSVVNHEQFSYNAAVYLLGSAAMYNYTNGSSLWAERTSGILNQTIAIFFPEDIAYEVTCEATLTTCDIDMRSFKAYLTRSMAAATKLAPFLYDSVMTVIQKSASAAALQCSGSPSEYPNGRMCGLSWAKQAAWDGTYGVGQQMAALEVIQSNLIGQSRSPLTNRTGGTSVGDPSAGISDPTASNLESNKPITTSARAGAGIMTALVVAVVIGGLGWLSMPDGNAR